MGGGEVGGDRHGLPAEEDKQPERQVKKDGGKDENAEVDAPFGSPDGHRCAYMTCKHGDLRAFDEPSATSGAHAP